MAYIFGALIGYLLGSINIAYVIAALKKVDIKNVGTKNPGASNVFISIGRVYGVIVGLADIMKSFLSGFVIYEFFGNNYEAACLACAMAVFGHVFPIYTRFRGGKGFAPFIGVVLFYDWKLFLVFALIIVVIVALTKYIAIATFTLNALLPLHALFIEKNETAALIFLCVAALIWFKHRDNMKRLITGKEVDFFGKVKK